LRDVIAATESIPLIASSIMSKKMAAGSNKLVLEVTCGNGAFMKDIDKAKALSKIMKEIGALAGIETVCIITNMDQPIGRSIGNSLEIEEAQRALKGDMQNDVKEVVLEIVAYILKLAGEGDNLEENKRIALREIENRKGISEVFRVNKEARWRHVIFRKYSKS